MDETVALLPPEIPEASFASQPGVGFKFALASENEVNAYLAEAGIAHGISEEFKQTQSIDVTRHVRAIRENQRLLALGVLIVPRGMKPVARLLVHARADHVDGGLFADYLLDHMTREACSGHPILIEIGPCSRSVNRQRHRAIAGLCSDKVRHVLPEDFRWNARHLG